MIEALEHEEDLNLVMLKGSKLDKFFSLDYKMKPVVQNGDFHLKEVALAADEKIVIGFILTRYGTDVGKSFGFFKKEYADEPQSSA